MRKLLPFFLLVFLTSCASYTIQDGYDAITLPDESGPKLETRYRLIAAAGGLEQLPAQVVPEAEEAAGTGIQAASESAAEEADTAISEDTAAESSQTVDAEEAASQAPEIAKDEDEDPVRYPEDLSEIAFPYLYTVNDQQVLKDGNVITAKILLLDLGYGSLSEDDFRRMLASVSDTEPDYIVLNGSLENQAKGAMAAGMNAVTLEGGTVLYSSRIEFADNNSAVFSVSDGKEIEIAPISYEDRMPSSTAGIAVWIDSIKADETDVTTAVMANADGMVSGNAVIALSSPSPSSSDWKDITPYGYRYPVSFQLSDSLEREGWADAYRDTHFSAGTDSGITSFNGDIYERLDFMYIKGMMPDYAISFPVAGLTDTTGNLGLIAKFAIP